MTNPIEPRDLAWRRVLARAVLWFERLLPALLPAIGVAAAFLTVALLDWFVPLPWWLHAALLTLTGLAILGLLIHGLWRLSPPEPHDADRRLERDSGLSHRPLAALTDRPTQDDPVTLALWRAHIARGLAKVRHLRLNWPSPGMARRDRRALRMGVGLALFAAIVVAGRDGPSRIAAAFAPGLPRLPPARAVEIQAWATPPSYTGLAPIFLKQDAARAAVPVPALRMPAVPAVPAVTVPAGARLTINLTGGSALPAFNANGARTPFIALDQASFQHETTLIQSGRVTIERSGSDLAAWDLTVVADQPPLARWTTPPGPSEAGSRVRLPWTVSDDYGVIELHADLRLAMRPDATPLSVPIPLPGPTQGTPAGATKTARGIHPQDLIAHPWAGLEVDAVLVARDGAGQTGSSEVARFTLPEREFHNEIAKDLIQIRKGLSLHPADRGDALAVLDDLMQHADRFGSDSGAYLNLSAIYYLLVRGKSADTIPDTQARLWNLALYLEEGQTEETARALEAARKAVRDAMDAQARDPSEANRKALEQKLTELREAIDRHMRAMMEEAERDHQALPFDPSAEHLSNEDLDRLAEEARQAAKEGRMDEAREKMAQLEKLLEQLKQARADKGQGNSQERQKARRQMGAVQDLVAREGGLLDHADARAQNANRPRRIPDQPDANTAADQRGDKSTQQALRRALGEMMQQFGDLTGEVPPALGEADLAMRDSAQKLGAGDDRAAAESAQHAIEALQKGAREMGRSLARQFGRGRPGGEGEGEGGDGFGAEMPNDGSGEGSMGMSMPDGRGNGRSGGRPLPGSPRQADPRGRDPLGRGNQGTGLETGGVVVPEEAEQQRSQAIQEELRRRGAQRERPQRELDYIDRLLRRF